MIDFSPLATLLEDYIYSAEANSIVTLRDFIREYGQDAVNCAIEELYGSDIDLVYYTYPHEDSIEIFDPADV